MIAGGRRSRRFDGGVTLVVGTVVLDEVVVLAVVSVVAVVLVDVVSVVAPVVVGCVVVVAVVEAYSTAARSSRAR
jgi:hypothetical protein